jgi:hypothetical protein
MRHLVRFAPALALALAGAAFFSSPGATLAKKFPEPAVVPVAWELTFRHAAPRRIIVDVPGRSTPTAYWYLTYTVVNNTNMDQFFTPMFEMVTEDGKVYRGDNAIPKAVLEAIRKRENNSSIKSASQIEGKIRQGEEQAQDGVAIWEEPRSSMRSFSIFVSVLSGEFVIMKDDQGQTMKGSDGAPVIVRKTLELDYQIRGGGIPDDQRLEAKPEKWVMR